jgi:KUP system potassium uptake protein
MTPHPAAQRLRAGMIVGALGVVFGDIGTSPIYTLQTLFNPGDPHPVPISIPNVYGVVSLVFWSVMLIVTLTYVSLVMHADNDGEGGVMALITLVRRIGTKSGPRVIGALSTLGILGAALFFGSRSSIRAWLSSSCRSPRSSSAGCSWCSGTAPGPSAATSAP